MIQSRVIFLSFYFNDWLNLSKDLEFKIKKAFGQVVFIQLSYCKIRKFGGISPLSSLFQSHCT